MYMKIFQNLKNDWDLQHFLSQKFLVNSPGINIMLTKIGQGKDAEVRPNHGSSHFSLHIPSQSFTQLTTKFSSPFHCLYSHPKTKRIHNEARWLGQGLLVQGWYIYWWNYNFDTYFSVLTSYFTRLKSHFTF